LFFLDVIRNLLRIPKTYILTVEEGKKAEDDDFSFYAERSKSEGFTYYELIADHNSQKSTPLEFAELLHKLSSDK
jgi:hypothetical protein